MFVYSWSQFKWMDFKHWWRMWSDLDVFCNGGLGSLWFAFTPLAYYRLWFLLVGDESFNLASPGQIKYVNYARKSPLSIWWDVKLTLYAISFVYFFFFPNFHVCYQGDSIYFPLVTYAANISASPIYSLLEIYFEAYLFLTILELVLNWNLLEIILNLSTFWVVAWASYFGCISLTGSEYIILTGPLLQMNRAFKFLIRFPHYGKSYLYGFQRLS